MNTHDPIRSAAIKIQTGNEAIGSLAEIHATRPANPAHGARQDADLFRKQVNELFTADKHTGFRAKVEDINLTVSYLTNPKVSRPSETMVDSLLTVRQEMTAIIMAVEKRPDPRLAGVVSSFADLERSSTALALQEQKKRKLSADCEQKTSSTATQLRTTLAAPTPSSVKFKTAFGPG